MASAMLGGFVARRFGATLDGPTVRVALFWALLVAVPMKLVHGAVYGVVAGGPILMLAGLPWFAVLLWAWVSNLQVAGWAET